jgi:Xaa-Pro dipeptidase
VIPTAVPREELERRRDAVLTALGERGVEVAVFTTAESVLYLTGIQIGGFWGQQAVVLSSAGAHRFVPRAIEMAWHENWAHQTWCDEWMPYQDSDVPAAIIAEAAKAVHGGTPARIGFELERTSISHATVEAVVRATSPGEVVSVTDVVERLRVVKSPAEVVHLREAGRISRVGHEAGAEALRGGATDAEAMAVATAAMYREGSEFVALGPLVAIGAESAMPHPPWRRAAPRPGELVTIETSASVHRYQGPIERTYVRAGAADDAAVERLNELLGAVVAATEAAIAGLRPGLTSHEADALARDVFAEAGVGDLFVNRLGYSLGLAFPPVWWENEIMQLRPRDERVLEPGMTFHIVPALHLHGAGYMVRSRALVLTEGGCELLNDMPLEVPPL